MPGETSFFIDNLPSGNYYIKVTDQNNCFVDFPITIGSDTLQIVTSSSIITDVDCYPDCDGSITVDVTGGVPSSTGAYSYQWNDPLTQTTQTAIGLCAGTYTCIVTDMEGCSVTETFIVTQPDELIATIQATTPIPCNGDKGDLKVTTVGGWSGIITAYIWSSGSTTNTALNLSAGSYSCFVTDINGCTDTAHYYLDEPPVLEILTTDFAALCKGEATGEIHVVATGGTPIPGSSPNWTYELLPGATTPVNPIVGGTAIFTDLSTGIYTVTVTDFHGCDTISADIFVGEPDNKLEITIDTYDESCNQSAGATVYPTGGTPGYTILWNGSTSAMQDVFQSLASGSPKLHTVEVWDANFCYETGTASLLGYQNVFLPDSATSFDSIYCMGDQIVINIDERPGLSYEWTMDNVWTTALGDDTIISTTANLVVTTTLDWDYNNILNNLHLTITDEDTNPVCSQTVTATISLTLLPLNPSVSNAGDAPHTISEGTQITLWSQPSYDTYSWTNTYNEELATVNEFSITPTNSDWYYIYATEDNCIGYDSIYVAIGVGGTNIVDAISPDGDSYNDDWYIEDLGFYNSTVQLFNRWGEMLFEYKGKAGSGKDRITNNDFDWESLSIGTYYYIIDLDNGSVPQTGPLTIIK
jgi:hypothetical protein